MAMEDSMGSTEYEYVVVQELPPPTWGSWTTKVSGPYSEDQAREVVGQSLPGTRAKVVKIVRPVYWLAEDDDLARFRPARLDDDRAT